LYHCSSGVKAVNKFQIGCGPNGRLEMNELNSGIQDVYQELNHTQFINTTSVKTYSNSSKKSLLYPPTQTNPSLQIKSARSTRVKFIVSVPKKENLDIKEQNILTFPPAAFGTYRPEDTFRCVFIVSII